MTTLLIAEHDHETLKDVTNKALTAASQLGGVGLVELAALGERRQGLDALLHLAARKQA